MLQNGPKQTLDGAAIWSLGIPGACTGCTAPRLDGRVMDALATQIGGSCRWVRDLGAQGVPGALEQALVDAPVRIGEVDPVAVQHIVRSFGPCMVCTVH